MEPTEGRTTKRSARQFSLLDAPVYLQQGPVGVLVTATDADGESEALCRVDWGHKVATGRFYPLIEVGHTHLGGTFNLQAANLTPEVKIISLEGARWHPLHASVYGRGGRGERESVAASGSIGGCCMSPFPQPRGKQSKVVHLSSDRHHVVLGTAGTGKSTMAMMRALHLARKSTINNGPVLVITFNNALVTYLKYLGPEANPSVTVETYSKFATGYLNSMGRMSNRVIAQPEHVEAAVEQAVAKAIAQGSKSNVLDRETGWFVDELHWISGMGIETENDYQRIQRVGRQTPLQPGPPRSVVWKVRDLYLEFRAKADFKYDWYDLGSAVKDALRVDDRPRMYRHVIIDEGQDLSPEMIRSLTLAVPPGGSVTFFGDYHQAIYGQGMSWRSAGIQLQNRPVEKFKDNYRNTAQIARVAIALAQSPFMKSSDSDLVEPVQPTADGPKPTLIKCRDKATEANLVRDLAREASKDQKVAILIRNWADDWIVNGIPYVRLKKNMMAWNDKPGLYLGAYHSAKGLEFDTIFMPFLSDDNVPDSDVMQNFVADEACAREARLLYVAVTRARSSLVMSYSGTLTRLLPENNDLWSEASI
ncbi:3'-5' exonuclease [Nocardia abscessus]|uniref:3'-5' exonuclease n=1 Tax=Nocardia abscessus TaxID=120957 RepID=UPI0024578FFE|nr:3'-5' exonuclease [Nocardia abscessus]